MLLDVKQLRNRLNVSRDTAYALVHAKGFPSMKIGGRYYVSEDALKKWLVKYEGREFIL